MPHRSNPTEVIVLSHIIFALNAYIAVLKHSHDAVLLETQFVAHSTRLKVSQHT